MIDSDGYVGTSRQLNVRLPCVHTRHWSLRCAKVECSVRSEGTFVLFDLTTKSAKKLRVPAQRLCRRLRLVREAWFDQEFVARKDIVTSMKSRVRSLSWVACGVRCSLWERFTTRGQMSSFKAWCPVLLSLGQPLAKAGYMDRLMRLMVANGTDERVLALHTEVATLATVKLAGESDESASGVVV